MDRNETVFHVKANYYIKKRGTTKIRRFTFRRPDQRTMSIQVFPVLFDKNRRHVTKFRCFSFLDPEDSTATDWPWYKQSHGLRTGRNYFDGSKKTK